MFERLVVILQQEGVINALILTPLIILIFLLQVFFAKKIILARLREFSNRTEWPGFELFIIAIKDGLLLWFFLLGVYLSAAIIPLAPVLTAFFQKILLTGVMFSITIAVADILSGIFAIHTKSHEAILRSTSIVQTI